jgi:tRNA nucleotidyltransferase (CCA-adding enzyme)
MNALHIYLDVPQHVKTVCSMLRRAGHEAYVVGGCVRDRLLDREPNDWDVTTSATPTQVKQLEDTNLGINVVPTGEKYGTMTVFVHGRYEDTPVEVTTYRLDGDYSDGRRPDKVVFGKSLEDDVKRRDFTINALAYDPIEMKLIDYVGGIDDLIKGKIRTVGTASDRFNEDGLRVLRACRFGRELDFSIEFDTAIVFCERRGRKFVKHLSAERVRAELFKILACKDPRLMGIALAGLFDDWLPEWQAMKAQPQNRYHKYDVWEHTCVAVSVVRPDPLLRFATLLHDVGKPAVAEKKDECRECGHKQEVHVPEYDCFFEQGYSFVRHEDVGATMAEEICKRFKLSNDETHYVTTLVREHLFYYDSSWTDAAVRRFVKRVPVDYLDDLFEMCRADRIAHGYHETDKHKVELIEEFKRRCHEQLSYKPPLKTSDLAVSGNDVMQVLGIGPGPKVGEALKRLHELVLDDPSLNEKDKLLLLVKNETSRQEATQ